MAPMTWTWPHSGPSYLLPGDMVSLSNDVNGVGTPAMRVGHEDNFDPEAIPLHDGCLALLIYERRVGSKGWWFCVVDGRLGWVHRCWFSNVMRSLDAE